MEKHFKATMILNWKTGDMRIRKRPVKGSAYMGTYDIPIEIDLTVEIPERQVFQAKGKITLSEAKATGLFVAEL